MWFWQVVLYLVVYSQSVQAYKPCSVLIILFFIITLRSSEIFYINQILNQMFFLCLLPICMVRACLVGQTVVQNWHWIPAVETCLDSMWF